jgi:SAM-dependent methyltransferase
MNAAHLEFCASHDWRQMVEEIVLPAALADVDLGDDVLEIGPGPGFTTDVLRARADRLTAVEIDHDLATALAERLAGTNVDVIEGDATELDLPDGRFTGATSFNMLHHVPTRAAQDQIFRELARVMRTNGWFVAADTGSPDDPSGFHVGDTYNPVDPEELPARLADVGFTEINIRPYDLGWICTAQAPNDAS